MTGAPLLERMAAGSRQRAAAARASESEAALCERALAAPEPPRLGLGRFDLIAELKLRSPALGALAATGFDLRTQVSAYASGGAAAVSVLTEPEEFAGSLEHLEQAAALLRPHGIPVMRKDFLTEPYQVLEARAAGAGGVLVIAAMLDDAEIEALLDCARDCGLFVLLEAFDAADLERIAALVAARPASPTAPLLAGVNSRDLRTLAVDFDRLVELAPRLPADVPAVAESGIDTPAQVERLVAAGYSAALVGSALMRSASPAAALAALLAAGRARGDAACS